MFCALALLVLAAPAPDAAANAPRVAVIALVDDAAIAADLQRTLEVQLASEWQIVPAAEIAAQAGSKEDGVPAPPALDLATHERLTDLFAQTRRAYALQRHSEALDLLSDAGKLLAIGVPPLQDRLTLLLWKMAVFLDMGEMERAKLEARAALALSPDLSVDLDTFRPSVAEFFDAVRKDDGPPVFTVELPEFPVGTSVLIDNRAVRGSSVRVAAGPHRIEVRARGFRPAVRMIDVTSDVPVALPLAIAIVPALRRHVADATWAWRTRDAKKELADLASELHASAIVVVSERAPGGDRRALLWVKSKGLSLSPASLPTASGSEQLEKWIGASLATKLHRNTASDAGTVTSAVAGLKPVRASRSAKWRARAEGGFAFSTRESTLASRGGGYQASFGGAGPRVIAGASRDRWRLELEAAWTSFALRSKVSARGGTLAGGTTAFGRVAAGRDFSLGRSGWLLASAGGSWSDHQSVELRDAAGSVGLFPDFSVLAVDGRVAVRFPIGRAMTWSAGLGIEPWSQWQEKPSGASGRNPSANLGASLAAGLVWDLRSGWAARGEYAFSHREVRFSGPSAARITPAVVDAVRREDRHSLTVSLRRSF